MNTDSPVFVLDKIMALVAPHQSATSRAASRKRGLQSNKEEHRGGHHFHSHVISGKKGGRMSNHEFCDSCKEGGDLLCCDKCPSAFHFYCHDPPVDPDKLPEGEWKCRKCRNANAPNNFKGILKDLAYNLSKSNSTQFSLPPSYATNTVFPGDKKETAKLPNGQLSTMPSRKNQGEATKRELCFYCNKTTQKGLIAFCDFCPLAFHLDCLDPPLTKAPTRIWMCPCHPHHDAENFQHPRVTKRMEVMDMMKEPINEEVAKRVFYYNVVKSNIITRKNVYSFYCRPEPTVIPAGIKSLYESPIQQDNTPSLLESLFTPKEQVLYLAAECDMKVPVPCGVPRTQEHDEATRNLVNSHLQSAEAPSPPSTPTSTLGEATAAELTNERRPDALSAILSDPSLGVDGEMMEAAYNLLKVRYAFQSLMNPERYPPLPPGKDSSQSGGIPLPDLPPLSEILRKPDPPAPAPPAPPQRGKGVKRSKNGFKTQTETKRPSMSDRVHTQSHQETNPLEQAEEGEEGVALTNMFGTKFRFSDTEKLPKVRPLPISPDVTKLDPKLVELLALERLRQLFPDSQTHLSKFTTEQQQQKQQQQQQPAADPSSMEFEFSPPLHRKEQLPRGILLPLSGKGPTVELDCKNISIGIDASMSINLRDYGSCGFVSGHHASIYLDQVTARFHLLNYSPHGTAIDRVLYGPDLTKANPTTLDEIPIFLSDIQAIGRGPRGERGFIASEFARNEKWQTENILQKSKSYTFKEEEISLANEECVESSHEEALLPQTTAESSVDLQKEHMLPELNNSSVQCRCTRSRREFDSCVDGWEGSGTLRHGSEIEFGCISFVLSLRGQSGHSNVVSILKNKPEQTYKELTTFQDT